MDRLTVRETAENGRKCIWLANRICVYADSERDEEAYAMAERIARLEDLAEQGRLVNEEDVLKFYYIDSEDKYVVGQRIDTMYYAEVTENLDLCFYMSRYLPWGEHSHCSEPREIPFSEWLKGFIRKREEAEAKLAGGNEVAIMWRRFRQALCWLLQGRDEIECMLTVLTSGQGESLCNGCGHNEWRNS